MKSVSVLIWGWLVISMISGVAHAQADSKMTPVEYYRLLNQANAFYDRQDYRKSEELFSKLVVVNPVDGDLWLKLGNSSFNLKKYRESIEPFKKAIELGFYNKPVGYFRIARSFALSGNREMALHWLERSLQAGYRNKTTVGENSSFELLRSDARFLRLINAEKTSAPSRAAGWTRDIDHLVSEIKRTHYVYRKEPLPARFKLEVAKLKRRIPDFSDARLVVELQRLMAMIGDGHTLIYPFGMKKGAFRQMPLTLYFFSDGLFVIDADEKNKDLVGKKIVKFGVLSTETALERLDPYISRDNPISVRWTAPVYLLFADYLSAIGAIAGSSGVTLTVAGKEGKTETATIETLPVDPENLILKLQPLRSAGKPPLYLSRAGDNYWFEKINDETVYFQFNQVIDKKEEPLAGFALRLRAFLKEHKIKNLIVDVRRNNGGESTLLTELWRTLINFEASRQDAKIFVLIGRNTYSAAQNFINTVEKMTKPVFIGEPSGAKPTHVGDEAQFVLPYSGVIGQIAPGFHQSANRDDRLWIAPHVPVEYGSSDYFSNHDPVLDAALKIIEEKKD